MERPQQRSRPKSAWSFKSDKSNTSNKTPSRHREDLRESPEEQRSTYLGPLTKANPNAAMVEAQPVAQQLEDSTLGSLRSMQHMDSNGNPIVEPDISNPTRPRWERPLDTIRSFEAAIDGEYRRRASIMRQDESMSGYASRRSSYYGGFDQQNSRQSQVGGFYGNRQSYYDNGPGQAPYSQPTRQRYTQRMQSDSIIHRYSSGQGLYHQSRDTLNTGGSGSQSEQWGHSTDPSSENSSIERHTPIPKLDDSYGYSNMGGPVQTNGRIPEERESVVSPNYRSSSITPPNNNNGYLQSQSYGAPPVGYPAAMAQPAEPRKIIRLSSGPQTHMASNGYAQPSRPALQHAPSEKRKSWFKRRFSKD